jgi:tetratricopeptide (TPR) repeat protein
LSEARQSRYELYREAKSFEASGRYDDALQAYAKAIELSSDYAHAWYYKSKLHYKLQQYDEAKYCAEKALKIAPSWEKHIRQIIDGCNCQTNG